MNNSIETNKSLSPTLSNLIAEINYSIDSVKEKILAAYTYAIDKDGFTPKEAAKLLREKLEYSDRYIREVLPLEAKDQSKVSNTVKSNDKKLSVDAEPVPHNSQETDKNVVNITTAYDIKEAETTKEEEQEEKYRPNSALEKFRQERGTVVNEGYPEEDTIYDKAFVDRLVKENAELKQRLEKFTFEYDLEVKDQILPLLVTCFPDKKTGFVRFNKNKKQK